jgi:hypothetical protein
MKAKEEMHGSWDGEIEEGHASEQTSWVNTTVGVFWVGEQVTDCDDTEEIVVTDRIGEEPYT